MTYESKRAEFRNYLDRSGAYNGLLRALKFLNKEDPKPAKLIYFVRHKLCETCPQDEKYDAMADEVDRLGDESLRLDRELSLLQTHVRTPEEIKELCLKGLKEIRLDKENKDNSYILAFLTEEVIDELKDIVTSSPAESNLFDCVELGFKRHEVALGLSAPDAECFELFGTIFEPCLKKAYEYQPDDLFNKYETDWGEISQIPNIDPEEKYVTEAFIMVSRNIFNYPFIPKMSEAQLSEIEDSIMAVANQLRGQYAGRYLKLQDFNSKELALLYSRGLCFKPNDPRLHASKCYRFWPANRGVYSNDDENFAVFINWVDHLRVKSFARNGDLGKIYYNLLNAFQTFEGSLLFTCHETYGFLSPDLMNLGSGIVAGVTMKLPYICLLDPQALTDLCKRMGIVLKKQHKEKQFIKVEIAPSMERNEYAQIKTLSNACEYLIKCDQDRSICETPPEPVKVDNKMSTGNELTMGENEAEQTATADPEGQTEPTQ